MVNTSMHEALQHGTLAQLVEQRTFNPLVAGSNPARPTTPSWYIPETLFTVCTDHIVNTHSTNG